LDAVHGTADGACDDTPPPHRLASRCADRSLMAMRCSMCGNEAAENAGSCAACVERYEEWECTECGSHIVSLRGMLTSPCSSCRARKQLAALPAEVLSQLDRHIAENHKLKGIVLMRTRLDCALTNALEVFVARYEQLRETAPERFAATDDEYWEGFHS
jgi:hypothetical protein